MQKAFSGILYTLVVIITGSLILLATGLLSVGTFFVSAAAISNVTTSSTVGGICGLILGIIVAVWVFRLCIKGCKSYWPNT